MRLNLESVHHLHSRKTMTANDPTDCRLNRIVMSEPKSGLGNTAVNALVAATALALGKSADPLALPLPIQAVNP